MLEGALVGFVGLAQGLRHALEPDHVTALATVVVQRPTARSSVRYAAAWGLGHGAVLVALGGALVVAGKVLPARVGEALEIGVALMLIALGARAFGAGVRRAVDGDAHAPRASAVDARPVAPLLVGCVHGLAGSGALAAMALGAGGSRGAALAGLFLYASGAALGMMLLAGAAGPALARLARSPRLAWGMVRVAAGASILLGVVWLGRSVAGLYR
jgi:high-affinity nickel-transport protein